jgi:hypothetical protein
MTDLCSIGTLFAFVLVSGGVLMLPKIDNHRAGAFKLPYINGRFIVPVMYALFIYAFRDRINNSVGHMSSDKLQDLLFLVYVLLATVLTIATFIKSYSLIPILGVLFCAYLLIEIPAISWKWFFGWMAAGLIIYFLYGYRKSKLAGV